MPRLARQISHPHQSIIFSDILKGIMSSFFLLSSLFAAVAFGQQAGTLTTETHPPVTWQQCTSSGCTTVNGMITLDANWRWTHSTSGSTNCYTGNTWDATLCPDDATCAKNCALDGAAYSDTYGITTSGNAVSLGFVTSKNVGSRVYLMESDTKYKTFNMLNQEFTFDVDVSNLPCGLNGALYMVGMSADGGTGAYSGNKAGPKYGTGYCDAQCPRDLKFINGEGNVDGWKASSNNQNTGVGNYGSCCAEMDIWEANSMSSAVTPHSSDTSGQTRCSGDKCGGTYSNDRFGGTTDPDGCDWNSYRMGNTTFYGPGMTVDTKSKFTVVTQFLTTDGTSSGTLNEIKRFYVQNGVVIPNSQSNINGVTGNSLTPDFCTNVKKVFGDTDSFATHGGFSSMSKALQSMVLVLSLWDDYAANMLWLDSTYPTTKTAAGGPRGSCATDSGVPADVEKNSPSSKVIYSNIKVGSINSTFGSSTPGGGGTTTTQPSGPTTTANPGGNCASKWGQCGGNGWTGPTCCTGSTCTVNNQWYSQCL
jgi:cellulose 1,4-beta-cellobiosidase